MSRRCDLCGGDGEQVVYPGPSVDPYMEPVRQRCGPCNGSGRLPPDVDRDPRAHL